MKLDVIGLVVLAAVAWAVSSQIEPDAMEGSGAVSFRTARAVITVVVMALVIVAMALGASASETTKKELEFRPSTKATVYMVVAGLLGTVAGLAYYIALQRNDGHATSVVALSTPLTLIFTALVGALAFPDRERLTGLQWAGVAAAIAAVGMISWDPKMKMQLEALQKKVMG